jgi:two-component system response regulator NreC
MKTISVVIVDDHAMVRAGLRQLLGTETDIRVIGEAGDGVKGLEVCRTLKPDVVVLDVAMPRMGGLESIRLLRQALPEMKIVILSMFSKESFAHEALRAGANAYILKGAPSDDLLEAIHAAHEGRFFFSQEMHATVISSYVHQRQSEETTTGYNQLSDREQQVFRLLIEGNSTADIAKLLCVSIKTAEKHRTSVAKKLKINSPVEMMKYAIRIGLVDPETWSN